MHFCGLGSGSKGNATLVRHQQTLLLIDCGFNLKQTQQLLAQRGCVASDITAILVTHEHSDHIQGVKALAKRFQLPVYMSAGTARSNKIDDSIDIRLLQLNVPLQLGEIMIVPVAVPHDAREPCQFTFQVDSKKLGILTDLGSISAHVRASYQDCDALLLEANHDVAMLMNGVYPPSLKQRVVGDWGHLSNAQARDFLLQYESLRLNTLVLGHISDKNNALGLVEQYFEGFSDKIGNIHYASQHQGFDWLRV